MNQYSFSVIRYGQDQWSGERLNVGVVLYCREKGFVKWKFETRKTKRLAEAFREFSAESHRFVLSDLDRGLLFLQARIANRQHNLFEGEASDVAQLLKKLWPDKGGRYTFSDALFDVSDDIEGAIEVLFERYVTSQMPEPLKDDNEKDEGVWRKVEPPLRARVQLSRIVKTTVNTHDGPVVARVFQNGKLNVIQPLSFDLHDAESITRKAHLWFARAYSFDRTAGLDQILYLVDGPRALAKHEAYNTAVEFLRSSTHEFKRFGLFTLSHPESFYDRVEALVGRR